MKVRQIKKRSLKMMQKFLRFHWKFQFFTTTETQVGLGVHEFAKEILQNHDQFMKKIERPLPNKSIGESEFLYHLYGGMVAGAVDELDPDAAKRVAKILLEAEKPLNIREKPTPFNKPWSYVKK